MKKTITFPRWLVTALAILLILLCFLTALRQVTSGSSEAQRQQLEDSIRRAAVACYATEGYYPPDLEHLKTFYGIQIDDTRYAVHYEVFAENLMPDITVVPYE